MGFWDKVKAFFGAGGGDEPPEEPPRAPAASAARPAGSRAAPAPATPAPRPAGSRAAAAPAAPARGAPAAPAARSGASPYAAAGILALSRDELRQRALKIDPMRTAWIGRVDTIPPQSDERTALIDRGLVLRGLLTERQIAEIHEVGDLWLRHHEAVKLAADLAARAAREEVEEQRRQKAERKAEKKRLAAERKARRAEEIARRRAEDIVYLGPGVSHGLADRRSHVEALAERGLPVLSTPADVARALDLAVPRLRWLCFHSEAAEQTHYVTFQVPKRSGGMRTLSAPHASLATAQEWILRQILDRLPTEEPANGFVRGRSTVTNASRHVGRDVLVNLDLSDFFPTITFRRVRGVFETIGYSPAVATVLALLCTESPRRDVEFDGRRYRVALGERALPQGACTSPALSNQVARKLDRRLAGMSRKMGWVYTRYADDLSFSGPREARRDVGKLMARVRHVVADEGFAVNPKKGRVERAGGRMEVTGIVVNEKLSVPREEVRRLRAILHQARKTGLAAQNREGRPHFEAWLRGKLAYVQMVDRPRGEAMLRDLDALLSAVPSAG